MSDKKPLLKIENAKIICKNFKGAERQYNPEGKRTFCVVLNIPTEEAMRLEETGWNIRILKSSDDYPDGGYMLPVEARFKPYPPVIWIRRNGEKPMKMEEATVGELDNMSFQSANLIISGNEYEPHKIKAYLREMYADVEVNQMAQAFFSRGVE